MPITTLPRCAPLVALVLWSAGCGDEAPPPQAAAPGPASRSRPELTHPGRLEVGAPGPVDGAENRGSTAGPAGRGTQRVDASAAFERGTLLGRIYVEASTPRPPDLSLDGNQERHCEKFGGIPDLAQRSLVTDAAGGLAGAVVWVEVPGDPARSGPEPTLVKRTNRFESRVVLARPGSEVRFENADPCSSTLTFTGALQLQLPLAAGAQHWQTFVEPGEVRVADLVHPWLESWVVVRRGLHVVISGRDGSYELPGLPPGEQILRVWHPALGPAERTFTLDPGAVLRVEVRLPPE